MKLREDDLYLFFKPYQVDALNALWNSSTGLTSREVWQAIGTKQISRASVINSLNAMVEAKILTIENRTGKGGYHGVYLPRYNKIRTKQYLVKIFKAKLDTLIQ